MRAVCILLLLAVPAFAAESEDEARVRAMFQELIAQRDAAQARAVQLAGELAAARQCEVAK